VFLASEDLGRGAGVMTQIPQDRIMDTRRFGMRTSVYPIEQTLI
jgi:hypothetical protein